MDLSIFATKAFREIFQSMSEGIIIVDESGNISIANPIAEQIFGYESGELIGKQLENLMPERYWESHIRFRKNFNSHPQARRMGRRDLVGLRKDGSETPIEISLNYTTADDKLWVMAFIIDISLRKKAEDALKKSEEQLIVYATQLEQKVQARTEALNQTIDKLESEINERKKAQEEVQKLLQRERELNELKSKFVSIASHEFRTPLSAVMSSASLIQQYKNKSELEKVDKHVQRIKFSVEHLTSILNDFLSLGKLEEGVIDIVYEAIDLYDFLEEIKEEITLKNGQDLRVLCFAPDARILTDVRILRHILFNLLSNASKYSEENKKIDLECSLENGQIIFTVRDEGIGVPKDEQKHMFHRFFRASNTLNIQGTGLGLNIVKRYVDLLNGAIVFTSEYGKGSTFIVSIPISKSLAKVKNEKDIAH